MSILTDRNVSAGRVKAIVFGPMGDALRNHLVTLAYVDMGKEMAESFEEKKEQGYEVLLLKGSRTPADVASKRMLSSRPQAAE